MASLRTVLSMALWWGCIAEESIFGSAVVDGAPSRAGNFIVPNGFECSDGVKLDGWMEYLDEGFFDQSPNSVEECWTAVQAAFPDAEGLMFMTQPICRAMVNFAALAPDGKLKPTYPNHQGEGGVCLKVVTTTTTTNTTSASAVVFVGSALRAHGHFTTALGAVAAVHAALLLL